MLSHQLEVFCLKTGHTAKSTLCKNKVYKLEKENEAEEQDKVTDKEEDSLELGLIQKDKLHHVHFVTKIKENGSLKVKVQIESKLVLMEVDSRACKSVIHIENYNKLLSHLSLEPVKFKLKVVTGENISIEGQILVKVEYNTEKFKLPLIVLNSKSKFVPLSGRSWLNKFNPNWKNIIDTHAIAKSKDISGKSLDHLQGKSSQICQEDNANIKRNKLILSIKSKFVIIFSEESHSGIQKFKVDIKLKENVSPIFHRAYQMPFALKPKVKLELSKMMSDGIITKVNFSRWASPIVVIPKKNCNSVRICVDLKKTLNRVIDSEHCVLPLSEDIYANLRNSQYFIVIDLKGAYQQLEIGESSKELFTINTHMGLFRYNRLTYEISSAPGIFQSIMESILARLANTQCYLDDILIHGLTMEECCQCD